MKEKESIEYPRYMCPKCRDNPSLIVYDYGKRKPVCSKCGTPFSNFIQDFRPSVETNIQSYGLQRTIVWLFLSQYSPFLASLSLDHLSHLRNGGNILLLGSKPFPSRQTSFQTGTAGRPQHDLGTVLKDHPIFTGIPHDGFADWQFETLLEKGRCVVFNKLSVRFDPILEVISSFKDLRLQASIWEAQTEEGGKLYGLKVI